MSGVLILLAHPQFQHSRVNRAMVDAARRVEGVVILDLYERYPDFHIHVTREKDILMHVQTIVLQHPLQWYSCPSLMKEWIDLVLQRGWAYGEGGRALKGKNMLSAITAGGPRQSYHADSYNHYSIHDFLTPFEQTATLCGMKYLEPFVCYNSLEIDETAIADHANAYVALLKRLVEKAHG